MINYWYIWFKVFKDGECVGEGVYPRAYTYKSSAVRRAKQMWSEDLYNPITGTTISRKWTVRKTNPWDEPQKTHYDPVAEAYEILCEVRDAGTDITDFTIAVEKAIGFLGEALA